MLKFYDCNILSSTQRHSANPAPYAQPARPTEGLPGKREHAERGTPGKPKAVNLAAGKAGSAARPEMGSRTQSAKSPGHPEMYSPGGPGCRHTPRGQRETPPESPETRKKRRKARHGRKWGAGRAANSSQGLAPPGNSESRKTVESAQAPKASNARKRERLGNAGMPEDRNFWGDSGIAPENLRNAGTAGHHRKRRNRRVSRLTPPPGGRNLGPFMGGRCQNPPRKRERGPAGAPSPSPSSYPSAHHIFARSKHSARHEFSRAARRKRHVPA